MKKTLFLLALLPALVFAQALQTPVRNVPAGSEIDPKQQDKDYRTWRNLIKVYITFRQQARAALEDLGAVSDFAWAAQKQLVAIERLSQRAVLVWDNVREFRTDSPVQMVKDAEEKIFQNTDGIIYYNIPSVRRSNAELSDRRAALANRAANRLEALGQLGLRAYRGFETKFFKTQAIAALDDRTLRAGPPNPEIKAYTLATSVASKGLAGADLQNQRLETQGAQLTGVIRNASPDGNVNPEHQAEMNKVNQRNALTMNIQSHALLQQATDNASWLLLARARRLERVIGQKSAILLGAEAFAEEVERQRALREGGAP